MARRGTKNDLVKCEYCGEMYSVTYKHCPFCNEDGTGRWDDPETREEEYYNNRGGHTGGKRLAGGSRRGGGPGVGAVIGGIVSLALIIAAVCIVISLAKSFLGEKKPPQPAQSTLPTASADIVPSADPVTPTGEPVIPSADPTVPSAEPVVPSAPPAPQVTTPSVDLIAPTSFKLSKSDITLDHVGEVYKFKVTYAPDGARGDISWKSSNPNVASISWDGTVTAVSSGTVTITATVVGAGEKSCIVRCNFKEGGGTTTTTTTTTDPAPSSAPSGSNLKLSRSDFTLSSVGDSWRLVVSGTGSAVTWASTKPEVATISGDGTVTAVSKGTCKVTATVDGVTLECIVRCTF